MSKDIMDLTLLEEFFYVRPGLQIGKSFKVYVYYTMF